MMAESNDARQFAPATARNRDPILGVLKSCLPTHGTVLEIASGTGEHAVHFTRHLPGLTWQPSDPDPDARRSISAWIDHAGIDRIHSPLPLDVTRQPWPFDRADAVLAVNLLHIAPWPVTRALFEGAAAILPADAPVVVYGPFKVDGAQTAPSNAAFDDSLRARNPLWGIRDRGDVTHEAGASGFRLTDIHPMPANNQTLVFRRNG